MAGNGNGNGHAETTCPHGCSRCRAIELGFGGQPLTPAQLIEVQGVLAESTSARVRWSSDTAEAALAVDLAQAAYDAAHVEWSTRMRKVETEKEEAVRTRDEVARQSKLQEIDRAEVEANTVFVEVGDRLRSARRLHRELARRDSDRHHRAIYEAGQEELAARREQAKGERRRSRLSLLRGES